MRIVPRSEVLLQAAPDVLEGRPMNDSLPPDGFLYLPLIHCAEFDSPIDALLAMHVAHDEAMDLVAASWSATQEQWASPGPAVACVLGLVDGGRAVAAWRLDSGRWAACNAFPEFACARRGDAERQLGKMLRRGRRGYVAGVPYAALPAAEAH